MIYDINQIIGKGVSFPPKDEIKRLDGYRVNALLLDDEAWVALPEYANRVKYILSNFAIPGENVYLFTANYWSDLVNKTQELTYGEPPEITSEGHEEQIAKILEDADFISLFG